MLRPFVQTGHGLIVVVAAAAAVVVVVEAVVAVAGAAGVVKNSEIFRTCSTGKKEGVENELSEL